MMMNPNQNSEPIVQTFVASFNRMCWETGRNYLLRTKNSKNETSKNPSREKVVYKSRATDNGWEIFAESRFLFLFKRRYPLLKINLTITGKIVFEGLFVSQMPAINQNAAELQAALQNYLNYCRNSPEEAFVNV
jgi:hypothetical protein